MTPPGGASQGAQHEPAGSYVEQPSTFNESNAGASGAAGVPALHTGDASASQQGGDSGGHGAQSGIEKDVGTILAGLNQEQLATIVAAARASDSGEQPQYDGAEHYDSSNALAHLPPGLGQAASTLTSFASSFKRTNPPVIPSEEEITGGASLPEGSSSALGDAPPPPGMEHDLQQQQQQQQSQQQQQQQHAVHHGQPGHEGKGAAHDSSAHDSAATAAALAAMGTLAGRHLQQHGQPHALGDAGRDDSVGLDAKFVGDHGLANARYKRKGPELDRQRKDNHKEVERRRRSAINDGIVQLSQIVPGCDVKNTNKGSIIVAAVRYIQDLKNNEASNIEKWTLEKLLMDQAMNDLSVSLEESRREADRLRAQLGMAGGDPSGAAAAAAGAQDKHAQHPAGSHGYADQRFQPEHGHSEHDIAVALDQGSHASGIDPFGQQHKGSGHGIEDGSDANKRARLV